MSINDQGEPRARQAAPGAPLDLMAVYDNLVPMIQAHCGDLASTSNPVMFSFIDTRALQAPTSSRDVRPDIARALWTHGLQALHYIADAALDPSRQLDAVSRLGLERGFCPDLVVLAFQFSPAQEMCDGRLQKRHSDEPRVGAPHRLQVELRAHGCAPVIVEWKVLQREGSACAVPPPPRHFVGPVDLAPPSLPTAAARAAFDRAMAEAVHRQDEEAEAQFASKGPTFFVQSPSLRDSSDSGWERVWLNDPVRVRFHTEDSEVAKVDPRAIGFVRLDAVDGLIVPTFYGTDSETDHSFWPRGTEMVVYPAHGGPTFKIVVIQPLKVVPSGP